MGPWNETTYNMEHWDETMPPAQTRGFGMKLYTTWGSVHFKGEITLACLLLMQVALESV